MNEELLKTFVEVTLPCDENFLKVKETLTRMGIASKKGNNLYQSCHILHKKGKYYIVHFKELFELDGKVADFSETDRDRRDRIALFLEEWGLVKLVRPIQLDVSPQVRIIPFSEKSKWNLVPKYNIGKPRDVVSKVR